MTNAALCNDVTSFLPTLSRTCTLWGWDQKHFTSQWSVKTLCCGKAMRTVTVSD